MNLPLLTRGKVREVYELDAQHLVMIASDRLSAFDVVMAEPVPDKGRVLTGISSFWFDYLCGVAPSHLVSTDIAELPDADPDWAGRMMLVRRAEMLPIECIVRGYLSGSAWKEYRHRGTVHAMAMPSGLRENDRLPDPVFTPSTKAASGIHDENISFDTAVGLVGGDVAEQARALSLALFEAGARHAAGRGIIVADTKFELGFVDEALVVADEILTPDSSRFWPADAWEPGTTPPSFDKQPVRDWLETRGWDKQPPPPPLPDAVVTATRQRYIDAYERLTGLLFSDWPGAGHDGA